ncbi:transglutaminase domain-containing protein [Paenibacillus arenilitoris]|uniref:Transglutaminase domain-containing protein n=1 Tax=Paenibacillus arenilitoris TaxID=2772299 RepID=A0A927H9H5_9BACL|nr:transglutaminase-like domain-containing protein [Paenibacillus arenilitoris]MBD2872627.1 transglutaminase domain-containing protein [Paenibacillus arenilitoris]
MRKFILLVVSAFLLFAAMNVSAASAASGSEWLNQAGLAEGIVSVKYAVKAKVKTKLMIAKGSEKYTYNLTAGKKEEFFPLQLGNGEYTVSLLEHVSGTKYKVVKKETVKLNMKENQKVFLNSVQNIAWTSSGVAAVKAKELTKGLKTDTEKIKAIHDYIITNIKYDDQLAAKVPDDYLPNIDNTLKTKKAICYGYASLFAAMLRSINIPTKLVMGESAYVEVYHAWNEVWLNGKWITVDTTVDAGLKKSKKKVELIKDSAKYTPNRQY